MIQGSMIEGGRSKVLFLWALRGIATLCLTRSHAGAFQSLLPRHPLVGLAMFGRKVTVSLSPELEDKATNSSESLLGLENEVALLAQEIGFSLSKDHQLDICDHLKRSSLWSYDSRDKEEDERTLSPQSLSLLLFLARDFIERPEVFSSLLMTDFSFPPLVAHQTRAIAMAILKTQEKQEDQAHQSPLQLPERQSAFPVQHDPSGETDLSYQRGIQVHQSPIRSQHNTLDPSEQISNHHASFPTSSPSGSTGEVEPPEPEQTQHKKQFSNMKSVVVNEKSINRRKDSAENYEYSLPSNYNELYPVLASELEKFNKFMTQPSTHSQESPIRSATANVYLRHAKLFLGWYVNIHQKESDKNSQKEDDKGGDNPDLTIFEIIPNKDKESASRIIEFIQWLRIERTASVSYEANVLRGLIKLLKYRFAMESESDSAYSGNGNTFDDIPIIKELRKLHRDANQRTKLAPRSSNEQQKWLSWPEFLHVTECTKREVLQLIAEFEAMAPDDLRFPSNNDDDETQSIQQAKVAEAYQRWLILAFFANIPDRQRTIREIEIGRTLVKDYRQGDGSKHSWVVKHGPDDYKTGKSYGERPTMQLSPELTPAIDDFIENWRPALRPKTNYLFVQSRTGKPMTGDSVFQRVSRCCFNYTGKRTNPHLLRDMIVTHVRESSEASEKELEALALYMGHSIHMQRTSYDRRTLSSKVAPAVKLMQSVNNMESNGQ